MVAVGCMAERYGAELAESLPEAAAVLGFDHYPNLGERLDDVVAGRTVASHTPVDRRTLLPITPVQRPSAADVADVSVPGHGWGPRVLRKRLDDAPVAALKIASGCDRRCSFCAIPSFRGAFVSRPPDEIVAEAAWLAEQGVRELFLVSENSTSYGKDLGREHGGPDALERLLPAAGRAGRHRAGAGVLPAARGDPAGAAARDRGHRRRRRLLRHVLPARELDRAAPDAPLRRHRVVPRARRPDPRAARRVRASAAT